MAPKTRPTLAEALLKAEHYCAYQERCHSEVKTKLRNLGLRSDEIDDILVDLIQSNFLNEERFALAYVSGKYRAKNWGIKKIVYHLKGKGINQQTIDHALKQINQDDYTVTIQKLIIKKDATIKVADLYKRKATLKRYLAQKGFEHDLINDELKKFYSL